MGETATHADKVFAAAMSSSAAAVSRIAASWRRSVVKYGLDPANEKRLRQLDRASLKRRKSELQEFVGFAACELDRLFQVVGSAGSGLFLTDRDGVVIDHRSDAGREKEFGTIGLEPGALCGEDVEGTNGMGTCLAEQRPVIIHRDEHFHARNAGMTCVGVPVFGAEGELIAALDFSSARADQTRSANMLVAEILLEASRRIETAFFCARHSGARILMADPARTQGAALLAVDSHDIVIGATRAARLAFDLGLEGAIAARPTADLLGLTREEGDLTAAQRSAILRALARSSGNVAAAARQLGIGRATLYRQMERHAIRN